MLEAGIKGREEVMVTEANSAAAMGSGLLPVFATPAMVALMEQTSWKSVAPYLNEGEGTVRIPNGFPYGPLAFAGENTGLTRST